MSSVRRGQSDTVMMTLMAAAEARGELWVSGEMGKCLLSSLAVPRWVSVVYGSGKVNISVTVSVL